MEFANNKVKILAGVLVLVIGFGVYGTRTIQIPAPSIKVPNSCLNTPVLAAIKSTIPGASFIPTKWAPAPNTELADILNNGGIACSYGLQSAEVGVTIKWLADEKNYYESWSESWLKDGYAKVDLSSFGIANAYFLGKPQSKTQEINIWSLNFKSNGIWVSINRSSGGSYTAANNLIKALIK